MFYSLTPNFHIFPPLLVLKLRPDPLWSWKNVAPFIVLLFGLFVLIGGLTFTIKEVIEDGFGCTEGQESQFCLDVNTTVILCTE